VQQHEFIPNPDLSHLFLMRWGNDTRREVREGSSEKVQRGFCSVCGFALFWNPTIEGYEFIAIAMGTFETPTGKYG